MGKNSGQPGLLAALADATEADLAEVRAKLAALQNEVASLKEIEKILRRKFPEEEEPATDATSRIETSLREKSEQGWSKLSMTTAARDLVELLEKQRRKGQWMRMTEAGRILGKAPGSITAIARHQSDVFEISDGRVRIRDEAVTEQEAKQQKDEDELETIHDYLCEAGPAKPALVAAAVKMTPDRVAELVEGSDWFGKTADGYANA